jgi:hypothetical protein
VSLTCVASFLLAGRILLIFLFIGFIFQGEWSFTRLIVAIFGLGACVMVAIGFKARWSAIFLVLVLSVLNVFVNNFWSLHSQHHQRDFLKYDFFQTLCKPNHPSRHSCRADGSSRQHGPWWLVCGREEENILSAR